MWVRFLRNTDVTEHGEGPAFEAGQVADLKVPSAVYWKGIGAAVDAEAPIAEPEPVPEPAPAPETTDQQADDAASGMADEVVEIPDEWASLHWTQRVSLARKLTDDDVSTKDAADTVIAAEIARRAAVG